MKNTDLKQVEIYGISFSSALTSGGYAMILKELEGERQLPIIIGQNEANAIGLQLQGIVPQRPLTHDLIKNIIETFGYTIEYVYINDIRDSTFFAKIKFDTDSFDEIDSRPSDAIALALKFDAPIFCSAFILDEIGFKPEPETQKNISDSSDSETESDDIVLNDSKIPREIDELSFKKLKQDTSKTKEEKLSKLKKDLDSAIEKEEYEKAAELRDEIKKIEFSNN